MESRTERETSAGKRTAAALGREIPRPRRATRIKARPCNGDIHGQLHDEVEKQVAAAAAEIVRAAVERAKAGSLLHTKWLCSLVAARKAEATPLGSGTQTSLAEILLRQLRGEQ